MASKRNITEIRVAFEDWYLTDIGERSGSAAPRDGTILLARRESNQDVYNVYLVDRMWLAWQASALRPPPSQPTPAEVLDAVRNAMQGEFAMNALTRALLAIDTLAQIKKW